MRSAILVIAILSCATLAGAQGGIVAIYSDDTGSSCELADSGFGFCSYYVIHSLAAGVSGLQFRVESQHDGIPTADGTIFPVTFGTAATGVLIDYGQCMDVTTGLHVLTLNYFCQGSTPPCATMEVVGYDMTSPPGLLATDCQTPANYLPAEGWVSFVNNDGTCPCGAPGFPGISIIPDSLQSGLCPGELSIPSFQVSNVGVSDLDFNVSVSALTPVVSGLNANGGTAPVGSARRAQPFSRTVSIGYYGEFSERVGGQALENLGVSFNERTDIFIFLSDVAKDMWDFVVYEDVNGVLDYETPGYSLPIASTLGDFVSGGGKLIVSASSYAPEFVQVMEAGHVLPIQVQPQTISRWTGTVAFNVPNVVPDLVPGPVIHQSSATWFGVTAGGVALAGFADTPSNAGAIILGNSTRTLLNGFLFEDYLPTDSDTDGKPDVVELVENEIRFLLLGGIAANPLGGVVEPDSAMTVEVTLDAIGLSAGTYRADVIVASNDVSSPDVTVPVRLDVLPPVVTSSSPSVDEALPSGDTSLQTLTVLNVGDCDLHFEVSLQPQNPPAVKRLLPNGVVSSVQQRSGIFGDALERKTTRTFGGRFLETVVENPSEVARAQFASGGIATLPVDVAVLAPPGESVPGSLFATGMFTSVTSIDVGFVTPSLQDLQAFDAVLVWWDFPYLDPVALGDNLADYVDAGGGVVLAVPETGGELGKYLAGRWESEEYYVIARSDFKQGQATLGTILDPEHFLVRDVNSFDGGDFSFRPSSDSLTAGSTMIATWSDSMPLVATKLIDGVRRVDLGFFPPLSTGGDGTQLMANALLWVTGKNTWWVSVTPAYADTVPPGSQQDLNVMFDARYSEPGDYFADIIISGNNPTTPQTIVPVSLTVDPATPVALQSFGSRWAGSHVEITWSLLDSGPDVDFAAFRKEGAADVFTAITNPAIVGNGNEFIMRDVSVRRGRVYTYRIVIMEGAEPAASFETSVFVPLPALSLEQNHPNPFNPTTTIRFTLDRDARVVLAVYDVSGRLVRTLVNERLTPGEHRREWDGRDASGNEASSGVYFYRLESDGRVVTRKMSLIR